MRPLCCHTILPSHLPLQAVPLSHLLYIYQAWLLWSGFKRLACVLIGLSGHVPKENTRVGPLGPSVYGVGSHSARVTCIIGPASPSGFFGDSLAWPLRLEQFPRLVLGNKTESVRSS